MAIRVFLTGGTGLIGRRIIAGLVDRGDTAIVLSRRSDEVRSDPAFGRVTVIQGDPTAPGDWEREVDGSDAVINLAGTNVFGKRWNARYKEDIRSSRVVSTSGVVRAIERASSRPRVLVHGSATGFYGPRGDEELTEASPPGDDFLARVCVDWERAAAPVERLGVRLATVRTGIVLARGEGALGFMAPVFKWLPGGAAPVGGGGRFLGRGRHWMPWIHLDDIVGLFLAALDDLAYSGPVNGSSPAPARNVEFSRALAKALHRPMLPFGPPDTLLRLVLGEVAEVITTGQRVLPAKALAVGFRFQYPVLLDALRAVFAKASA